MTFNNSLFLLKRRHTMRKDANVQYELILLVWWLKENTMQKEHTAVLKKKQFS